MTAIGNGGQSALSLYLEQEALAALAERSCGHISVIELRNERGLTDQQARLALQRLYAHGVLNRREDGAGTRRYVYGWLDEARR